MSRRSTELGLMVLVGIIVGGAYVLVSLGRTASIPPNIGPFLGVVLALLLAAHVANRILAPAADPILLPVAALLNGLGYVIIARLDTSLAGLQATWTAFGIAAYVATLFVVRRVRVLDRYRWTFALVGLGLLLLPLLPGIGREINGSRIWVSVAGVNFQPGEFAKVAFALFFASYLVEKREVLAMGDGPLGLPDPRHLAPVLAAWGMSLVVMVSQRDLGSSLLFFAFFVVMLWMATDRPAYLAVGVGLFAAGAYAAWRMFDHVQTRVTIWLDPWVDPTGRGFQILQSMFSLAWGGLTGAGLGQGDPGRIPAASSDFVFAAIGEEMGLFGATAVLAAFLLLAGSGLRVAVRADNPFDKLLAAGLTAILALQAFIIIGGVIRLVPLTGVTLPFVSYGGSSLLANYVILALLVRISDETNRRAARPRAARTAAPAAA